MSAPPSAQASLPTVDALERLWRDVTAQPLWRPPRTWRYLGLLWRMRLRLLSVGELQVSMPHGLVNDCAACTDSCCIGVTSTVLLRFRDIAALIDLGRTDLMTQQKPSAEQIGVLPTEALRRHVASRAWQQFPVLRQNRAHFCEALTKEGKCSLYPNWPLSCARFPYALKLDTLEVFYARRCAFKTTESAPRARSGSMLRAVVDSYNERIKDAILLEFARPELDRLGLTRFLAEQSE